jgi:5-methylcytosine-specific restriction endonuclease McrA
MATSRTGTSTWLAVAKAAKRRAREAGQEHCPYCKTWLDYDVGRQPNSAEADHIVPHSKGGQDRMNNVMVICRRCNMSKGNRTAPKPRVILAAKPLKTSRQW